MRVALTIALLSLVLAGCGSPAGEDLSKVAQQPKADLEAGSKATTMADWAASNPQNGAPGHGD